MCIQNNAPIRSNLDVQQRTTSELTQTEGQLGSKKIALEIPNLRVEGGDAPQQATSLAARRVGPLPTASEFRQELGIARFSLQAFRDTDTRAILKDLDRFHQLTSGMQIPTGEQAFEKLNAQMAQVGQAFTALDQHLDQAIMNKSGNMREALIAMKTQVTAQRDDYLKVFQNVAEGGLMAQPSKASLSTMASMASAGFTPDQARQLVDKGVSSAAAGAFLQAGLGFKEALEFGAGLRNPEAFVSAIRIAGTPYATSTTLPNFISLSNDPQIAKVLQKMEASGLRNVGYSSLSDFKELDQKIASAYCDAGVTHPKMMRALFRTTIGGELVRVPPAAVLAFKAVGITDPAVMKQLANNGYSAANVGELGEYARLGIGPSDRGGVPGAQELIDAKVPMDLVKAAMSMEKTNFFPLSAKEILAAHQAGFTPEKIAEYRPFSESAHKPEYGDFSANSSLRALSIPQAAAALEHQVPLALAWYATKSLGFDIETTAQVLKESEYDPIEARRALRELRYQQDMERMGIQKEQITRSDKEMAFSSQVLGAGAINQVQRVQFNDGKPGVFKSEPISAPRAGYNQVLGTAPDDGKQSARNVASGVVSEFLGSPVVAKGQYAVMDQRVGLVMELVPGSSISKAQSKIFTPSEQGQMRKQLVDLQILDVLTAQMDRHANNILFDAKGGMVHIRGIDNDGSFGTKVTDIGGYYGIASQEKYTKSSHGMQMANGTYCRGYPPVMDREQVDKVMSIDPQKFEKELALHLGTDEAVAARSRLEAFQQHLQNSGVKVLEAGEGSYADAWGQINLAESGFTTTNSYLAYAEKL